MSDLDDLVKGYQYEIRKLKDNLKEAELEWSTFEQGYRERGRAIADLRAQLKASEERERRMREALEFYANKNNWFAIDDGERHYTSIAQDDVIGERSQQRGGKTARDCIANIDKDTTLDKDIEARR